MVTTNTTGQQFSEPIPVEDIFNGRTFATIQAPFPLNEADFLRLKGGPPATVGASIMILSGVVGYIFSLGPKIILYLRGDVDAVTVDELGIILGGTLVAALVYGFGFILPNEKKRVRKTIETHFKSATPALHAFKGSSQDE